MAGSRSYPEDGDSFAQIVGNLDPVLDLDLRLPNWPLKA